MEKAYSYRFYPTPEQESLLRRTVDVLWQIPQIPRVSPVLKDNARLAVTAMKRFPL